MNEFWMNFFRTIGLHAIKTEKVKGKYMTTIKVALFGMSLYEASRKSTEQEKIVARKASK